MVEGWDTIASQGPAEAAVHVYRHAYDIDADQRHRIRENLQAAIAAGSSAEATLTDESRTWLDALRARLPDHNARMELIALLTLVVTVMAYLDRGEPSLPEPPVELLEQLEELQERVEELEQDDTDHLELTPNAPCPCGSGTKYKKCHGR
jgi:hypothetical protein